MNRDIPIIQIGLGGVGRALAHQILAVRDTLAQRYGFSLAYHVLADRSGTLAAPTALAAHQVEAALNAKAAGQGLATLPGAHPDNQWLSLLPPTPCIVVDVTATAATEAGLLAAVAAGHRVVLANKRPLTTSYATFLALTQHGATRYEATVGAGLPILATLQSLLDSGDRLHHLNAAMSGTLGFLCSTLEANTPLSIAVTEARTLGFTEPDPRDDLSGADVARKALILARTGGLAWEPAMISAEPWYPETLATGSVETFMERLPELDADYAARVTKARDHGEVLRYAASIDPTGATVGLKSVPLNHPLASLQGPDNLFSFTTSRYATRPLIIRGPGAGVEVTATGVLGDIIATAREML